MASVAQIIERETEPPIVCTCGMHDMRVEPAKGISSYPWYHDRQDYIYLSGRHYSRELWYRELDPDPVGDFEIDWMMGPGSDEAQITCPAVTRQELRMYGRVAVRDAISYMQKRLKPLSADRLDPYRLPNWMEWL